MMEIRNFGALREAAVARGGCAVAVASADRHSILAVVEGRRAGLCDAILIGDEGRIQENLDALGVDPSDFVVLPADGDASSAALAVELARRGAANAILKGSLATSTLMRAVLHREFGLRRERLLSDVRLCDHPFKKDGFLAVTDGGLNPRPTLHEKRVILENAVAVFRCIGNYDPCVAVLCAAEKVEVSLPHTVEAAALRDMNRRGEITGCLVDGPVSLDLAISADAARLKGYTSPVAGRADILLGPTIEATNLLGKSLIYFLGSTPGQVVFGAAVPVLIPSRADGAEIRLNSIALASLVREGCSASRSPHSSTGHAPHVR
jgi:phosphate butyryltransferase